MSAEMTIKEVKAIVKSAKARKYSEDDLAYLVGCDAAEAAWQKCVAVVEQLATANAALAQRQPTPYWRGGDDAVRAVLKKLRGGA